MLRAEVLEEAAQPAVLDALAAVQQDDVGEVDARIEPREQRRESGYFLAVPAACFSLSLACLSLSLSLVPPSLDERVCG